jgi:hypothetical protein
MSLLYPSQIYLTLKVFPSSFAVVNKASSIHDGLFPCSFWGIRFHHWQIRVHVSVLICRIEGVWLYSKSFFVWIWLNSTKRFSWEFNECNWQFNGNLKMLFVFGNSLSINWIFIGIDVIDLNTRFNFLVVSLNINQLNFHYFAINNILSTLSFMGITSIWYFELFKSMTFFIVFVTHSYFHLLIFRFVFWVVQD